MSYIVLQLNDSLRCAFEHTCLCVHIYVSSVQWGEYQMCFPSHSTLGTYAHICHRISVHLPVFQGSSACASKRQLRVSLEGPPGAIAPVTAAGKEAQGQQLSSVYSQPIDCQFFIWTDLPSCCFETKFVNFLLQHQHSSPLPRVLMNHIKVLILYQLEMPCLTSHF